VLVAGCRLDLARLVLITAWCSVVGLREVPVGVPVVMAVGSTDYLVTASIERPRIRGLTWPLTCIVVGFTAVTKVSPIATDANSRWYAYRRCRGWKPVADQGRCGPVVPVTVAVGGA
jgi:hypothetical protein